jgi:hypothetical protein
MSRAIFIVVACLVVVKLYLSFGSGAATGGLALVAFAGSMVWFGDFWAEYILPFGFWHSKATDFKTPERSAGALAVLGWVMLLLLGYAAYFLPPASTG